MKLQHSTAARAHSGVLQGYAVTITPCSYWATANLTGAALFDSQGGMARFASRAETYVC